MNPKRKPFEWSDGRDKKTVTEDIPDEELLRSPNTTTQNRTDRPAQERRDKADTTRRKT